MEKIKNYLKSKKYLAMGLVAVIVGVGIGYGLRSDDSGETQPAGQEHAMAAIAEQAEHAPATVSQAAAEGDMLYICPMNCVAPTKKPGKCPVCGMDLVAMDVHEHQQAEHPARITLSEESKRAAGIQVAPVEEKFITADIKLYGKIEYDPVEIYKVSAFTQGRL